MSKQNSINIAYFVGGILDGETMAHVEDNRIDLLSEIKTAKNQTYKYTIFDVWQTLDGTNHFELHYTKE